MLIALLLCIVFCAILMMYASPIEDVSLDLSLLPDDNAEIPAPANYDDKGWSVYTQDDHTVTELTPPVSAPTQVWNWDRPSITPV